MSDLLSKAQEGAVLPIHALHEADLAGFLDQRPAAARRFADISGFKGRAGEILILPQPNGEMDCVLFGLGTAPKDISHLDAMAFRGLAAKLPEGQYQIASAPAGYSPAAIALAWSLGLYGFTRYKSGQARSKARLIAAEGVDVTETRAIADACTLAKDMVNTPANDMGPVEIETIARDLAKTHGATISVITGDALLSQNYPAVHAVGRAADPARASRMIEMAWGVAGHPHICIIGKGVVFDTGGLDMKPSAGMRLMKKDMGGAAHALALAELIMSAHLPIRLHMLVAAAENSISGNAMRPGDIVKSRKGITVEIDNTDAEGRLVLADALTKAVEDTPELIIDFATLTGAARVALGPDLPAMFSNDDETADALIAASKAQADPLWRMPLWAPYMELLDSDIADMTNSGGAFAGAVTAALFMQKFVPDDVPWVHLDTFAWRPTNKPGRPKGGEALGLRAVFGYLADKYPAR